MKHWNYDVGIVGYGPVGAALAILLAQHNLTVVVLEREAAPYPLPRAIHFDGEVMRVFQQLGIARDLEPSLFINLGARFVNARQELLIDWPRPQGIGPQGWHASYRFHQPELECALRATLAALRGVDTRHDVEVTDLVDDGSGVRVSMRDTRHGEMESVRCRYVVGCDGARSFVRSWLGANLIDLQSNAQWLVVDLLLKHPMPDLSDWTIQLCDPDRPTTIARGAGNRRRWEFMVMPGDDESRLVCPDTIWRLLDRWVGQEDAELERSAVYRFQAVIAAPWRKGRVMIAGDAAHQTPPFLGQGLCAGIRDASNLAWKLAAALGGSSAETLLASYESERAPHVREFVAQAVRVGEILQATAQSEVRNRDQLFAGGPKQMSTPAPALGPGLHDARDPLGGTLFRQPRLADGTLLDDVVGNRWLVLVRPDLLAEVAAVAASRAASAAIVVAADPDGSLDELRVYALLVRPDRHILAGASNKAETIALFDQLDRVVRGG